jgi:aspartyl-tRNA(Asn)/glutamyl-tRNA(Gln) amidotransferase subunit B
MSDFKTIIGLEIHCQLKTESKMFCSCSNNAEGKEPNTVVCPICLGMPGTLPVTNVKALELTAKIGLALDSKLADLSWFDRKHYFYPDLPKGYQISQYQNPFCEGGGLKIGEKEVRFNRVHLEEDAGKLVHPAGSEVSFVDLNRAGTPLAEIVTEPDIESPAQAREFMEELRDLLRSIEVSDADMEKGHLRCDANISITKDGKSSPIVEIKNLNSFKFVEKALSLEEKRLQAEFEKWPEKKTKLTRGFNSSKGETYPLREKEEAKDYRYFPEPDIPPIEIRELVDIEKIKTEINKLPIANREEMIALGLDEHSAKLVVRNKKLMDKIYRLKESGLVLNGRFIKLLINDENARELNIEQLNEIAKLQEEGHRSNWIRDMIRRSLDTGKLPFDIAKEELGENPPNNKRVDEVVQQLITMLIKQDPERVAKYRAGRKEVLNSYIGDAMKLSQGSVDIDKFREELIKQLGD